MEIVLTAAEKGGEHSLPHDLNFQSERYEAKHTVVSLRRRFSLDAAMGINVFLLIVVVFFFAFRCCPPDLQEP